jgi:uncharacterized protein (DUF305 family)
VDSHELLASMAIRHHDGHLLHEQEAANHVRDEVTSLAQRIIDTQNMDEFHITTLQVNIKAYDTCAITYYYQT